MGHGLARSGRFDMVGFRAARLGGAGEVRRGMGGLAGRGAAGKVGQGMARHGEAWPNGEMSRRKRWMRNESPRKPVTLMNM